MTDFRYVQLVGPEHNVQLFGVKLLGVDPHNARKLLFTIVFLLIVYIISRVLRTLAVTIGGRRERIVFWTRQGIGLFTAIIALLGFVSIWFDNPSRLATGVGLVGAGLAFALQKVVTSFAGYIVIIRGNTFSIGDRITMGGVRGDVVALNFTQTVIMEMGQPPSVQGAAPEMWVESRQYSGRVVTVSNSKIFEEPVYNYTRDFPYIWEEMHLPIGYGANRAAAEGILLRAATEHTIKVSEMGEKALTALERRFFMKPAEANPRVYYRLTDNWIELSVRFLCHTHGVRGLKDKMSRDILDGLEKAKIEIASSTYDIVGFPTVKVQLDRPPEKPQV